ncbi:MAG: hypothetical protein KBA30_01135 [Clostridia bacterium]|nr:hypothetical protein [Clostridia bacterium]
MDMDTGNGLSSGAGFIAGDLYCGLVVVQFGNRMFDFSVEGSPVRVYMKSVEPAPGRMDVVFNFQPEEPARFRVDLLLPPDCRNAFVTLNGARLIGWFSDDIPEQPGFVVPPACDDGSETVSTLRPGQFQSLNFLWMRGDELVFHLYF